MNRRQEDTRKRRYNQRENHESAGRREYGDRLSPRQRRELQRRQERRRQLLRQYRIVSWTLTGIFVILFYAVICLIIGNRSLFGKTTINGIRVGSMTSKKASGLVNAQFESSYRNAEVKVELAGQQCTLNIAPALDKDSYKSVKSIQDKTHRFWKRGYEFLASRIGESEYTIYPVSDKELLKMVIQDSDLTKINLDREDGYKLENDKLVLTKGEGSYAVDTDKLADMISSQVKKGDYTTVLACPEKQTDVDIDLIYKSICCEPQNPTLDPDHGYKVIDARDGIDFDLDAARRILDEAGNGDRVEIPLVLTPAEMTTEEYEKLIFRDELGSYSSEVEGSDNRKTNVKLAAQYCDGTILMPGENYSYNYGVGELTEERGFLPGPSYANGESVLDMGGGICQVSTMLYLACLYANLEIDERHCHPYPSSYAPAGLDATVAWGGCDFIFTNDTDYPIKITTTYDGYSTSCTIWGTITEPFSVELYTETLETEPYKTKYELDKSLGKDEQILDTVGIDGLTIQSYRRVYDGDGNVVSDNPEATSVYSVRDEIYKVGRLPSKNKKDKKDDGETEKTTESTESTETTETTESTETT